jgi:hypothetical protein
LSVIAARKYRVAQEIKKEKQMHYGNGREAKNGDMVMLNNQYGAPVIGILYDAKPGNDSCNGHIAPVSPSDPCPNLKECLHIDDVKGYIKEASIKSATPKQDGGN